MALGLQNAYGVGALDDLVRERKKEQLLKEAIQRQAMQQNIENSMKVRGMDLQGRQLQQNDQFRRDTQAENLDYKNRALQQADELKRFSVDEAAKQSAAGKEADLLKSREHDQTMGVLRSGQQASADAFKQAALAIQQGQLDVAQGRLQQSQAESATKAKETTDAKARTRGQAVSGADDIIKMVTELKSSPGFGQTFGARIPGLAYFPGEAANASARLEQLKSALSIEKIMEMKAQSRTGATGFGQLSDRELTVLQNAAGRLQQSQTEESAIQALNDIVSTMNLVKARNSGASTQAPDQLPYSGYVRKPK